MKNDIQKREHALKEIQTNIAATGRHIYLVSSGPNPRFAYTIGCSQTFGAELMLAGACYYLLDEVLKIINHIAMYLTFHNVDESERLEVPLCGSFTLRSVDVSWTKMMMLGALDFYGVDVISAYQIVPDSAHLTIDVPNLSQAWNAITAPAWKWLNEPWDYPIPSKSMGTTNLEALRGERITEAMRWEEDEWELFAGAGPDVPKDAIRVVPLGTLLAADTSLEAVMNLQVGKGLWRDQESSWHPWLTKSDA